MEQSLLNVVIFLPHGISIMYVNVDTPGVIYCEKTWSHMPRQLSNLGSLPVLTNFLT